MTLAQMSQETFCCEVWCRLFYGRHYNNADHWPKDKLEWPKKERIKTGKLLGSFMPPFHISDIKDFQVPCHATVNALVLGLFLWRKKNTFSSSTLTLVTEGFARDEKYIFIQWFVVKFILSIGQVISRTPAISRII